MRTLSHRSRVTWFGKVVRVRDGDTVGIDRTGGGTLVSHTYAEQGSAAGRNLHDPDHCAPGAAQPVPITMGLNRDADGVDTDTVNGGWVRAEDTGASPLTLAGSSLRRGGGYSAVGSRRRWRSVPARW